MPTTVRAFRSGRDSSSSAGEIELPTSRELCTQGIRFAFSVAAVYNVSFLSLMDIYGFSWKRSLIELFGAVIYRLRGGILIRLLAHFL